MDGKVDDAIFIRIESMVMLVSSLCANHVTSKMICCSPTLIYILSSILDPHETRFVKIHLAATDALRSLIKDCDSNSVKVCSSSSNYSSLAEMLVAHLGRPSLSLLLFEEYLSCIQVIASQKTSGGLLLKVNCII